MTQAQAAEHFVIDRRRAVVPPDYRLFTNVAWLSRTAEQRGLPDCVIAPRTSREQIQHPQRRILR